MTTSCSRRKEYCHTYFRYCCSSKWAMILSISSRGSFGGITSATLNFDTPFPDHASTNFSGVSFSLMFSACSSILIRSLQYSVISIFSSATSKNDIILNCKSSHIFIQIVPIRTLGVCIYKHFYMYKYIFLYMHIFAI